MLLHSLALLASPLFAQAAYPDAELLPATPQNNLNYGERLALDAGRLAVARRASGALLVELREFHDGAWVSVADMNVADLNPLPAPQGNYKSDLDATGDRLGIADTRGTSSAFLTAFGSVLERQATGDWTPLALSPAPVAETDMDVALGDGWVAFEIGVNGDQEIGIWEPSGSEWVQTAVIPTPAPDGRGVSDMVANGDELIFAPVQSGGPEAIRVWRRGVTGWSFSQFLPIPPGWSAENNDNALAVDGDLLAASADTGFEPGLRARLFERGGSGVWAPAGSLYSPAAAFASLPAVAVQGESVAVGSAILGPRNARVFDRNAAGTFVQRSLLRPVPGAPVSPSPSFATALVMDHENIIAGEYLGDGGAFQSGLIHTWRRGSLYHGLRSVSLIDGGRQDLLLRPDLEFAGQAYAILGSLSGTSPGLPLPGGTLTLPLARDGYTDLSIATLGLANSVVQSSLGLLSSEAEANAAVVVPAGAFPSLVGSVAYHAFATLDIGGAYTSVSNPVALLLVP